MCIWLVVSLCCIADLVVLAGEGVAVVEPEAAAVDIDRGAQAQIRCLVVCFRFVLAPRLDAHLCMHLLMAAQVDN